MSIRNSFQDRVNYAAQVIANKRNTTRTFCACFENDDGDEVSAIIYRRARKNPKLRANIWKYLSRETVIPRVYALRHIPTRDMPKQAQKTRQRAWQAFEKSMAEKGCRP